MTNSVKSQEAVHPLYSNAPHKPHFDNIDESLTALDIWSGWFYAEPSREANDPSLEKWLGQKGVKIPIHGQGGYPIRVTDLSQLVSFETAKKFCDTKPYGKRVHPRLWKSKDPVAGCFGGIALVLTGNDMLVGTDLDDCVLPDGTLTEWAEDIYNTLDSYTEYSPSGKGLRIFSKGILPEGKNRSKGIEMYSTRRFLTVTGHLFREKKPVVHNQEAIDGVFYKYLKPERESTTQATNTPAPEWTYAEIESRLEIARKAKNKDKFIALYDDGDTADFPSESEADIALCFMLAFWLGKDPIAMDTAFRESSLHRGKWDELRGEKTYGEITISKAIEQQQEVYTPKSNNNTQYQSPQFMALNRVLSIVGEENLICSNRVIYLWSGTYWKPTDEDFLQQRILELESPFNDKLTSSFIKSVSFLMATKCLQDKDFNKSPLSANFKNCEAVLDIHTGQFDFVANRKESFFSVCIPHNIIIDENYTPEAPIFMETFGACFRDDPDKEDKIKVLLEGIGYSMLFDVSMEKFFVLLGRGANGKSTFLNLLEDLIGELNSEQIQPYKMGNTFYLAELKDKLVNVISELDTHEKIPDGRLKAFISGDSSKADKKYGRPFSFRNKATIWIASNHLPQVDDFTDALFRRAIVLGFNRVFAEDERDKTLRHKLKAEIPAIIHLALKAIGEVYKRGRFTIPQSSIHLVNQWQNNTNQVKMFIEEECTLLADAKLPGQYLYDEYTRWAQNAGVRRIITRNGFTKRLEALGLSSEKSTNGFYFYKGIMHYRYYGDL